MFWINQRFPLSLVFGKSVRLTPVWVCAMLRLSCAAYSGFPVRHAPVFAGIIDEKAIRSLDLPRKLIGSRLMVELSDIVKGINLVRSLSDYLVKTLLVQNW